MRVAVVCPGYWPVVGGVEMLVQETCEAMVRAGVSVEVWTQSTFVRSQTSETLNGVVVRRFPATHSRRFPISLGLARHVRRHAAGFDVVHAHNYHAMPAATALLVPRSVPVVFSAHFHGGGHTALARLLHVPYRPVGRRVLHRADRILAVSVAERDQILRGFPGLEHAIGLVPNGVDSRLIGEAEPLRGEPATALVLGRLEAYKRVGRAMSAFAALPDQDAQLVIIGDGRQRDRLAVLARTLGDRIRVLGALPRADVHQWLRTARVVINISNNEAFGVVVLEALCAGAVAVVSDIPAHREIAEATAGERVRLVDPSAPGQLERAMADGLAEANRGPRPLRSWDDVADDYLRHYEQVRRGSD